MNDVKVIYAGAIHNRGGPHGVAGAIGKDINFANGAEKLREKKSKIIPTPRKAKTVCHGVPQKEDGRFKRRVIGGFLIWLNRGGREKTKRSFLTGNEGESVRPQRLVR